MNIISHIIIFKVKAITFLKIFLFFFNEYIYFYNEVDTILFIIFLRKIKNKCKSRYLLI